MNGERQKKKEKKIKCSTVGCERDDLHSFSADGNFSSHSFLLLQPEGSVFIFTDDVEVVFVWKYI